MSAVRRPSLLAAGGLVLAVALGLVLGVWAHMQAAETFIGVIVEQRGESVIVVRIEPDRPAEHAGLEVGDRLVEVAGTRIRSLDDFEVATDTFEGGVAQSIVVERPSGRFSTSAVPGAPYPWGDEILTAICAIGYLLLALLSLRYWRADLRARLLALFSGAVAIELSLPPFDDLGLSTAGLVISLLLNGIQIGTELHLAAVIPRLHGWLDRHPGAIKGFYAAGLGGAMISIVAVLLDESGAVAGLAPPVLAVWEGPGYLLWAIGLLLLLGRQAIRYPEPEGRQQAALVLSGALPWIVLTVVGQVAEWLGLLMPAWTYPAWPIALLLYPVAVFVAIFRFHLFDLEAVVKRSLIYTTLTTLLLALFYAAVAVGGLFFSSQLEEAPAMPLVAIAALLAGLAFSPLRRMIERVVARRVFPERHAMRQRLVALAAELPALGTLPAMGRHLVASLVEIFAARSATILIADPKSGVLITLASSLEGVGREGGHSLLLAPTDPGIQLLRETGRPLAAELAMRRSGSLRQRLTQLEAALLVPLVFNEQLVGLLLLGAKRDEARFRAEELELLSLLAHHVASVLENARLFESATYESLTGVLRREAILELLEREILRASRYARPLALAMADLDHFKTVNDRFGHLGGDGVLQRVAQLLRAELRSADGIGRYGGEEFLLVLPETTAAGAAIVAEKIREVVAAAQIPVETGERIRVTLSIGLAEIAAGTKLSGRELLRRADEALYQAKREGRDRVVAWEEPVSA